jgi:hypothetical protein
MRPIPRNGYFVFSVKENGGRARQILVHRVILEAFRGPCPEGMEACHFPDPDPANNRIENLRWDTRAENYQDSLRHIAMGVKRKTVRVRGPNRIRPWAPRNTCACSHPDRYQCLRNYYDRYGYPAEDDEFCSCSCHVPEYLWDRPYH